MFNMNGRLFWRVPPDIHWVIVTKVAKCGEWFEVMNITYAQTIIKKIRNQSGLHICRANKKTSRISELQYFDTFVLIRKAALFKRHYRVKQHSDNVNLICPCFSFDVELPRFILGSSPDV